MPPLALEIVPLKPDQLPRADNMLDVVGKLSVNEPGPVSAPLNVLVPALTTKVLAARTVSGLEYVMELWPKVSVLPDSVVEPIASRFVVLMLAFPLKNASVLVPKTNVFIPL